MKTKIAAVFLAVMVLTSLALIGSVYAIGVTSIAANPPTQTGWVRIHGVINKWGTTDVRGQLNVQARTAILANADTRQFARATAVWTTNITRAVSAVRAKENFTYTFYSARLLNASVSTLSTTDGNFLLAGTWSVATVNCKITLITNDNNEIVSVHRESDSSIERVAGELTVKGSWTTFTLKLTGYDDLTGLVTRSVTRTLMFNWYSVTDVPGTAVTTADVNAVVQCYRAMPGWGNYNNRMDFNFNYRIDIADLATVAANM